MNRPISLRWLGLAAALACAASMAQSLPQVRSVPQTKPPPAASGGSATPATSVLGSSGERSGFATDATMPGPARRGYGAGGGPTDSQYTAGAADQRPWSAGELARSFSQADANGNGELSPNEAGQLTILPSSFDEMDLNHDEVLTRSEYETAARRWPPR